MALPNPLDQTHLAEIDAALRQLATAEQICARARRAGMPTEAPEADCKQLREWLENVKKEFFTTRVDDL